MVSGKRSSHIEDRKTGCILEASQNHRKVHETDEYEGFASSRTSKDSSTPNREDKRWLMVPGSQIKDTSGDTGKSNVHARTKNYSTVSLPNYDELDVARHQTKGMKGQEGDGERTKSRRPVRSSTGSLPAGSFLAPFSEVHGFFFYSSNQKIGILFLLLSAIDKLFLYYGDSLIFKDTGYW